MGDDARAGRAAMRGIRHPAAVIPPSAYFDPILAHLWRKSRMNEFSEMVTILRRREPVEPHLINNKIYLGTLRLRVGEDVETSGSWIAIAAGKAEALVKRYPVRPEFRSTAALALLTAGRTQDALLLVGEIDETEWLEAPAASQAIVGLVLDEAGEAGLAQAWRDRCDPAELNEWERIAFLSAAERDER